MWPRSLSNANRTFLLACSMIGYGAGRKISRNAVLITEAADCATMNEVYGAFFVGTAPARNHYSGGPFAGSDSLALYQSRQMLVKNSISRGLNQFGIIQAVSTVPSDTSATTNKRPSAKAGSAESFRLSG